MKIVAFAASNSRQSINKQLVQYACSMLANTEVELLDLNDFSLPLFSVDTEQVNGVPANAQHFFAKLGSADAIIISFAEHNGAYTAVYKNLFDWCSRIAAKVFQQKKLIMLSTSPGPRGGASVLALAVNSAPFFDGEVLGSMSVPSFTDNFDTKQGCLTHKELDHQLRQLMALVNE